MIGKALLVHADRNRLPCAFFQLDFQGKQLEDQAGLLGASSAKFLQEGFDPGRLPRTPFSLEAGAQRIKPSRLESGARKAAVYSSPGVAPAPGG